MLRRFFVVLGFLAAMVGVAFSQSEGKRLAVGFDMGMNKYWGDFTDNQFWIAGDLFARYNVTNDFSLIASYHLGQVRFRTNAESFRLYPEYFGSNPQVGDLYPNSNVKIQDMNSVRWMSGEITASYNFFTSEKFVPSVFGGLAVMNWEPKSGDTGYEGALPNNADKVYDKTKLVFPVGISFEFYITDDFVLNAKGTYRLGMSEYFDDLSKKEAANASSSGDAMLNFGIGFSYYILGDADYDKDGLTNDREREIGSDPWNPDSDGDGLKDGEEVFTFYTDPIKADTDKDGLGDYDEVYSHKTSPIKADSDSDGLNDGEEIARKTKPLIADSDDDGLTDGDEIIKYSTDPLMRDTDGDSLSDGDEVRSLSTNPRSKDTDADGLNDGDEVNNFKTNPNNADTDNDKISDGLEINTYKTNPNNPDTDGDSLADGEEIQTVKTDPNNKDTDADGLSDGEEVVKHKTNPNNPDSDRDNLNDFDELNTYKSNPLNPDTDGDALPDGDEVMKYSTSPTKVDTDYDLINDYDEITLYRTNPTLEDTDSDKITDGDEINRSKTDPLNPDTDADTIIDGDDDCPLTAGVASDEPNKNGCPAPPKIGTKTDFPDILFIVNTDNFNFEYAGTIRNLMKLLEYVNQCDSLQIIVEGHASEEGNVKRNQELSEMRAKKVTNWLIEQGVPNTKIVKSVGFGSSKPKIKEPSGQDLKKISKDELEGIRKQNRRITIEVFRTCD